MIKFVYKIFPAFVSYTNDMDRQWAGWTSGPFVKIRPCYIYDKGLLTHELTHVKQFYRTLGLHLILRNFKGYRKNTEVEAYRAQLDNWGGGNTAVARRLFAENLSKLYSLGITQDEAMRLLS